MRNWKKILSVSGVLMALGLVLTAAAYFAGAKLSITIGPGGARVENISGDSRKAVRETVKLQNFDSVEANVDSANVRFIPSDHYGAVVTYHNKVEKPSVSVDGGTLKITQDPYRNDWFQISYFFVGNQGPAEVAVYFPKGIRLDSFHLTSRSGNAEVSSFSAGDTGITCKYGDLKLSDASCGGCSIRLDDGSGEFQRVTATYFVCKW